MPWVAEPFSKLEDPSTRQKNYRKFLRFELATVTSQLLKHEGINYTILDKIRPLENVSVNHLKFK